MKKVNYSYSLDESPVETVSDNRRESIVTTLSYAWVCLDCKRLKRVLAKDVILYEKNSPPIIGINNVIHCHTIWFDRIRACIELNLTSINFIHSNLKEIKNFSVYIQENITSSNFLFVFNMKFSNNKIAKIEITHNDFIKIIRKYEKIVDEQNLTDELYGTDMAAQRA